MEKPRTGSFGLEFAKNILRSSRVLLVLGLALICLQGQALADEFKIAIMQAQAGAAKKFAPLETYLKAHGIDAKFVSTPNYTAAATMFAKGEVDGMFSGSGVAGTMILKGIAFPLVRPVDKLGRSTYWAVVIAPKGSGKFTGKADYFLGKKVIFSALASSGEFFFHSIAGFDQVSAQPIIADSHGAALEALAKGQADIAIVKNMVWDSLKAKYPNLEQVGNDGEQNPNDTLIVSKVTNPDVVKKVMLTLLGLDKDQSPAARAVKEGLGIDSFILTSAADFKHTLELLKQAGVTADFDFKF